MVDYHKIREPERDLQLKALLEKCELTLPTDTQDNLGVYEKGQLVGCGFLKGSMLQGIAIEPAYQGEGLSAGLLTRLISKAAEHGIYHVTLITKPEMAEHFQSLGFSQVAKAEPYATFLEFGRPTIDVYLQQLADVARDKPAQRACLVMNCNPFTKGHQYLVEQASRENEWVFLLVVEEDRSEFPFSVRMELVQQGVKELHNVSVLRGGEYVISMATFPSYFTKQEQRLPAQATLDAEVFGQRIAPALGLRRRYVGTEPFSLVTAQYNQVLQERLPKYGIEVREVERTQIDGEVISASRVRQGLRDGDWELVQKLVPEHTWNFLRSQQANKII